MWQDYAVPCSTHEFMMSESGLSGKQNTTTALLVLRKARQDAQEESLCNPGIEMAHVAVSIQVTPTIL